MSEKIFAYFSTRMHAEYPDCTVELCHRKTGVRAVANWIGRPIDGFPGSPVDGKVVRPPHYETYKVVGEIGIDGYQPIWPTQPDLVETAVQMPVPIRRRANRFEL